MWSLADTTYLYVLTTNHYLTTQTVYITESGMNANNQLDAMYGFIECHKLDYINCWFSVHLPQYLWCVCIKIVYNFFLLVAHVDDIHP